MLDLWVYWDGIMPEFINVCLQSIQRHCGTDTLPHLVTEDNMGVYLPRSGFPTNFDKLTNPAIRADFIRIALLHRYGGFWYDADTIALQSPAHLATNHDLVHCEWVKEPYRVPNGYLYARPGSGLVREWYLEACELIATRPDKCGWAALGEKLLTPLVESKRFNTQCLPLETFLPVDVDINPHNLFSTNPDYYPIKPLTVCFGLNNSWMKEHKPLECELPRSLWNNCSCLFHRVLSQQLLGIN